MSAATPGAVASNGDAKSPSPNSDPVLSAPSATVDPKPKPEHPTQSAGAARSLEVELAGVLVSSPQDFVARVKANKELSNSRRAFALALGRALMQAEAEASTLLDGLSQEGDVSTSEREFLKRLIEHQPTSLASAGYDAEGPLVQAAGMVADARAADAAQAAGRFPEAARGFSDLLLGYVNAPWAADPAVLRRFSAALVKSQQKHRWNRAGQWASFTIPVAEGDSLISLRKKALKEHPDLVICTGQIERANELKGTTLHPGQTLRIPTEQARMLVDLDAHWAFYLLGDEVVGAWEVGVGKDGGTRPGNYVVGEKKAEPMWFKQGQEPVPYGDPANPLGTRWIAWSLPDGKGTGLGFHGTNAPESIGRDQSQGCIRMLNADVEQLFEILPKGAQVLVQS